MTESLDIGLYETLITTELESRLARLEDRLTVNRADLPRAEVAGRIALHLSRVIERVLASLEDQRRLQLGVDIARDLLARLDELTDGTDAVLDAPVQPGAVSVDCFTSTTRLVWTHI